MPSCESLSPSPWLQPTVGQWSCEGGRGVGTFHLHILPRQMCPCWDLHVESSKRCVISQILSPLALLRVQGRAAADKAGVEGLPRHRGLHAMDEILIFGEETWITAVISGTEAVFCFCASFCAFHLLTSFEPEAPSLPDVATMKWSLSAWTL